MEVATAISMLQPVHLVAGVVLQDRSVWFMDSCIRKREPTNGVKRTS